MHVGIIMDGNGRWATQRGRPRLFGHHRGARRLTEIVESSPGLGVSTLTLYAFSTENWSRPRKEIDGLMNLFRKYLHTKFFEMNKENVRVQFFGDPDKLPRDIRKLMDELSILTTNNTGLKLNIAVNYGGRDEILRAVKNIALHVRNGELGVEQIDENTLSEHLDTKDIPDPDLIIRTSGEMRLSNFLTWQSIHSELFFIDQTWPEFTPELLAKTLGDFKCRAARARSQYSKTSFEQIGYDSLQISQDAP